MISKTSCQHCEQHIEFDAENAGQFVQCPNCHKQTRLLMANDVRREIITRGLVTCPDCLKMISRMAVACPGCGRATGLRFRLIWLAVAYAILANAIIFIIGSFIVLLAKMAIQLWS